MSKRVQFTGWIFVLSILFCGAAEKRGAHISWTTFEAEEMNTSGSILGPAYEPYRVETESSAQRCVLLQENGQWVEFTSTLNANSMILRFSVPDGKNGQGLQSTLGIYINGKLYGHYRISSRYAHLYGKYPFTNDPGAGKQRNFYDELRIPGLQVVKGDVVRIERNDYPEDKANYCILDLVDLENIEGYITAPFNSLAITEREFTRDSPSEDYTEAFRRCIAKAVETGKIVWIPEGRFKISGDILLPPGVVIQGAGMWHTVLEGDESVYAKADRRVRLKGNGGNIHLSDFAIMGKLDYRNDSEPNDGVVGSFGENSTISRLWIEHTKVGIWVENSKNLLVEGCRFRNTIADGINYCVGMNGSVIENCTTRGTGDDCFAIWPATFMNQQYAPGNNLITNCTGQLPFLANGAAIYGGESNKVKNCLFTDITPGSAILISTTFPTEDKAKSVNNNFSGTTLIENCTVRFSGGFDHTWDWRAAVQVCLDRRGISGLEMNNLLIENSLSDGLSIIANHENQQIGSLEKALFRNIKISTYGIGAEGRHGLWIQDKVHGSLTLSNSSVSEHKNESENFVLTVRGMR